MRTLSLLLSLVIAPVFATADLIVIDIGHLKPGYVLVVDGEDVVEAKVLKVKTKEAPQPPRPTTPLIERIQEAKKGHKTAAVEALALVYERFSKEVSEGRTKPQDALRRIKEESDTVLETLGDDLAGLRKVLSDEFSALLVAGKFGTKEQVSDVLATVAEALK